MQVEGVERVEGKGGMNTSTARIEVVGDVPSVLSFEKREKFEKVQHSQQEKRATPSVGALPLWTDDGALLLCVRKEEVQVLFFHPLFGWKGAR
mmetsp:Transcript_39420/g.101046  ORF Transcript_39420/g.101046 Transcript_39420/m.101046 type:complete len:93 (-) Transcript_39420:1729-2007(-)